MMTVDSPFTRTADFCAECAHCVDCRMLDGRTVSVCACDAGRGTVEQIDPEMPADPDCFEGRAA